MDSTSLKTSQDLRMEKARLRLRLDSSSPSDIKRRALSLAQSMLGRLPSNYPQVLESNLGALYRAISEEFCRYSESMEGILADETHSTVRPELLHQNLADYLCLGTRSLSTAALGEDAYRSFLLNVRDAYRRGSSKEALQESLSAVLGIPVALRELYMEARKATSPYGPKDTHRMVCDILMDSTGYGAEVSAVLRDLSFFLSLIKPAHTMAETRLLWEDSIGVCGDGARRTTGLAADANGVTYKRVLEGPARSYLFRAVVPAVGVSGAPSEADLVGQVAGLPWETATMSSVTLTPEPAIVLNSGEKLLAGADSLFFLGEGDGYRRVLLSELKDLDTTTLLYQAQRLPGTFSFYQVPKEAQTDPSAILSATLNQRPVFTENVKVELDPTGRFPAILEKPHGAINDRSVSDVFLPLYEDLRSNHVFPDPQLRSSFLAVDQTGDIVRTEEGWYSLPHSPIVTKGGESLAVLSSLSVYLDGEPVSDLVKSVSPEQGLLQIDDSALQGKSLRVDYWYADRYPERHVYEYEETGGNSLPGVDRLYWPFDRALASRPETARDIQADKIPMLGRLGGLASVADVTVLVNGMSATVLSVNPLLGHIELATAPVAGDTVTVSYYHTDKKRVYPLLADEEGHTLDSAYGHYFGYELVPDIEYTDPLLPVCSEMRSPTSSYKYRAVSLGGSSVLNSGDTLMMGDIPVPSVLGSLAAVRSQLGAAEVVFSPEYLTDKSKYFTLSDEYLDSGPAPVLELPYGTPSFERSFTDSSSGLIRSVPLPELANGNILPLLYSDLKERVVSDEGAIPLSPCADNRDLTLSVMMEEEYFPGREMRLSDYLDYTARKENLLLDDGEVSVLRGSPIVKSTGKNLSMVPKGSILLISTGGASGDHRYTVLDVLNSTTVVVSEPVSLPSGTYLFDNLSSTLEGQEVTLASMRRLATIDLALPGGSTGSWLAEVVLPDPDTDPYPYSPPNTSSSAVPSVGDVQDYHGHTGTYGLTGLPMSEADAEKMVKWRNWDQDIVFTTYLGATGVSSAAYPSARVRPGAKGPKYDLLHWDVYMLGYRGSPPGATGVIDGHNGQVSPGYGPGGVTGSLPYTTLLELVSPGSF